MAGTRGGLQNRYGCSQGPRKYLSLPKVAHCIQVSFVYGGRGKCRKQIVVADNKSELAQCFICAIIVQRVGYFTFTTTVRSSTLAVFFANFRISLVMGGRWSGM